MENSEEVDINDFEIWYQELIEILSLEGKRAPYKMAWLEFYDLGLVPIEAASVGPWEV